MHRLILAVPLTLISLLQAIAQPATTRAQDSESSAEQTSSAKFGEMVPVDKSIEFFSRRIEGKPSDVANRIALGRLYLRKAAEQDDFASFTKAEEVLSQAVKNNPNHLSAMTYLAKALIARHDFAAALQLANKVLSRRPANPVALSIQGDCELELGRYQHAEKTYQKLLSVERSGATIARQAHLHELMGKPDKAIRLLEEALQDAEQTGLSDENLAWYDFRLGVMHRNRGDLDRAEAFLKSALARKSNYAPAVSSLAAVHALQGKLDESIKLYEHAIETYGEPPMMWGLGDVYAFQGNKEKAKQWYNETDKAMAEEAKTAATAHFREVARFYCDTDRHLKKALQLAQQDLKMREDLFAYDTLAWAQFKNGLHEEALQNVSRALQTGIHDAMIHYHAGRIHEAVGNKSKAIAFFSTALANNPYFSLTMTRDAKSRLRELSGDQVKVQSD